MQTSASRLVLPRLAGTELYWRHELKGTNRSYAHTLNFPPSRGESKRLPLHFPLIHVANCQELDLLNVQ